MMLIHLAEAGRTPFLGVWTGGVRDGPGTLIGGSGTRIGFGVQGSFDGDIGSIDESLSFKVLVVGGRGRSKCITTSLHLLQMTDIWVPSARLHARYV